MKGLATNNLFLSFLEWDIYSKLFLPPIIMVSSLSQAFAFKGTGKLMNEFASIFGKYERLQIGDGRKFYNKVLWRVVTLNLIAIPSSVCGFVMYTFFIYDYFLSHSSSYTGGIAVAIMSYNQYIPASSSGKDSIYIYSKCNGDQIKT